MSSSEISDAVDLSQGMIRAASTVDETCQASIQTGLPTPPSSEVGETNNSDDSTLKQGIPSDLTGPDDASIDSEDTGKVSQINGPFPGEGSGSTAPGRTHIGAFPLVEDYEANLSDPPGTARERATVNSLKDIVVTEKSGPDTKETTMKDNADTSPSHSASYFSSLSPLPYLSSAASGVANKASGWMSLAKGGYRLVRDPRSTVLSYVPSRISTFK
jgi:hypothetical protein